MASAVNPQSVCEFCDPVTSTAEWTRKIGRFDEGKMKWIVKWCYFEGSYFSRSTR